MGLFDLSGKVALVTGSSRGIGRAIVEQFAAHGARVVVSSRSQESCEPVARGILDAGGEAIVIPCNVGRAEERERLINQTLEAWGRIDTLVCNAAANPVYGSMRDVEDAAFDKIMSVNVRANMHLSHRVLPQMAERRDGSIIIVSSVVGLTGTRMIGTYAISKAADFQLARNLAVEWGQANIRANCIAPGLVCTDFARALWEDERQRTRMERAIPLGRLGEPDDIAGVAVFLASDAGRYVTGQSVVADGGLVIRESM